MKYLYIPILLIMTLSLSAQNANRDAIKIGYLHSYFAKHDVARPTVMLEYTRSFYPPLTIGVSGSLSTAKDLITPDETEDLFTFNIDLNLMYGILDNDRNAFHIGLGLSARSFRYTGVTNLSNVSYREHELRPGIAALMNYEYNFDPIIIGFRGSLQSYSERGIIYGAGGFLGFRF